MKVRDSARIILLDDRDRVLLFKVEDELTSIPVGPGPVEFWITPGGGLNSGESFEQAAVRELWEETGFRDLQLGPWIWTREAQFIFEGVPLLSHERYFLAKVPMSQISFANLDNNEQLVFRDYHWWNLAELFDTTEIILPPQFVSLIEPIIAGRLPSQPIAFSG